MTTRLTPPAAPDRSRWAWLREPRGTLAPPARVGRLPRPAPARALLGPHRGRRARGGARAEPPVGVPGAAAAALQLARVGRLPAPRPRAPGAHAPQVRRARPRLLARVPDRPADPDRPAARHARRLLVPPDPPDRLDDPRGAHPQRHRPRGLRRERSTPWSASRTRRALAPTRRSASPSGSASSRSSRTSSSSPRSVLAALSVDRYRRRLLDPADPDRRRSSRRVLVLPFALWFVGEGHDLGRLYAREVRIEDGGRVGRRGAHGPRLRRPHRGASTWRRSALALAVVLPGDLPAPAAGDAGGSPGGRLLGWLLAWMLVLLTAAALGRRPRLPQGALADPGVLPGSAVRAVARSSARACPRSGSRRSRSSCSSPRSPSSAG